MCEEPLRLSPYLRAVVGISKQSQIILNILFCKKRRYLENGKKISH